jgi:cyclomaltodextrinase
MEGAIAFNDPPDWVSHAVLYQIFPDRFRRSGKVVDQHSLQLKPWGNDPAEQGFHGGDLYGVIEALDELQDMGVTCLYLTPIFSSAANHRYHAYDYLTVDPLLGGNVALDALISAVHRRGMRLVLDGVFNHCGRGFWAFHHLVENGEDSPYRDWFHVHSWPVRPYPDAGMDCGYDCWWAVPDLPKFNHAHPGVREHLLSVGRHWIERGIDGWRLDVPAEVPADFWVEFRRVVREVNPDAWIVGEIWGDARPWLRGEHFDGVMNYRLGWSTLCWVAGDQLCQDYRNPEYPLAPLSTEQLIGIWDTTAGWYRPEVTQAQMNLLDSHDVPRALHSLQGDLDALKLALVLLFLQPGAPCVYYGTEAALAGGPEPGCREGFPWDRPRNKALQALIQDMAALRMQHAAIREGRLTWSRLGSDGLLGETDGLQVVINRSRDQLLPLADHIRSRTVIWSSDGLSIQPDALGCQSAVVVMGGESP